MEQFALFPEAGQSKGLPVNLPDRVSEVTATAPGIEPAFSRSTHPTRLAPV